MLLGQAFRPPLSRRTTGKAQPALLGTPSHREADYRTQTKPKLFITPYPKHNQNQKMEDRGKGSRAENVYFHAQGRTDLADWSTRGPRRKAVSDEARPCARRAARTRQGGSGQGHERGRQELEAPGDALEGSVTEQGKQRAAGWKGPSYGCTLSMWAERWWCQSRRRV